jgi:hypothetical protein
MSGHRPVSERGRWASQLRRLALVAVLAFASSALLPFVHGGASHIGDCGVCSAIARGSTDAVDTVAVSDHAYAAERRELVDIELTPVLPRRDRDACSARAPPAASVTA